MRRATLLSLLAVGPACFRDAPLTNGSEDESSSSSSGGAGDSASTTTDPSATSNPGTTAGGTTAADSSSGGADTFAEGSSDSTTAPEDGSSSSGGIGEVAFNFVELCNDADWRSATGSTATLFQCDDGPGALGDVEVHDGAQVETGTAQGDVLSVLVPDHPSGTISGEWVDVPIESGARLKLDIACGASAPSCDADWQVVLRLNGVNPPLYFEEGTEVDDQTATEVDIDLDEWVGLEIDIAFAVVAGGSWSVDDELYFINPRVTVE